MKCSYKALIWPLFLILVFFGACARPPGATTDVPDDNAKVKPGKKDVNPADTLAKFLNQLTWSTPDGPEVVREPRIWDVVHQQIQVRFNFKERMVLGKTILYVKELPVPFGPLRIDAKNMHIVSVESDRRGTIRTFDYDSTTILVHFNKESLAGRDSIAVQITYRAQPPEQVGLHFVDPTGIDIDIPTQLWTLGQPEDNSYWVPLVDRPDERLTHELWISLPDSMISVSNGIKMYSRRSPGDSLNTEYWRMDKPHPAYLIAFAAGAFASTRELIDGVNLSFYTEKRFRESIPAIFNPTVGGMRFFTSKLGVPYPWGSYAQVAVHEFAAGGMENTGCTILFDGVQADARAAIDIENQDLVIHELAHQWFGNLVTCKDWSQLTLQEGMATFFEYRYRLQSHGKTAMLHQIDLSRDEYFDQASFLRHPLIWRNYDDPYDVFDKHTYNKGGQVFFMLYEKLGEDAFFKGLNILLETHAHANIDEKDVQKAFEEASEIPLERFFSQWFYGIGHPEVQISWDVQRDKTVISLKQIQDKTIQPLFALKTELEVRFRSGEVKKVPLNWSGADTLIELKSEKNPVSDVLFDPLGTQLAEIRYPEAGFTVQAERLRNPGAMVRFRALKDIRATAEELSSILINPLLQIAQSDAEWFNREAAASILADHFSASVQVRRFALSVTPFSEKEGRVRLHALTIAGQDISGDAERYVQATLNDPSYFVAAEAMIHYARRNPSRVISKLKPFSEGWSYEDVLRSAYVQALYYSTETGVFEELRRLAQTSTSRPYALEASKVLLARQQENAAAKAEKPLLWSFFTEMSRSSFKTQRINAYHSLSELDRVKAASLFKERISTTRDASERRLLEQLSGMPATIENTERDE